MVRICFENKELDKEYLPNKVIDFVVPLYYKILLGTIIASVGLLLLGSLL